MRLIPLSVLDDLASRLGAGDDLRPVAVEVDVDPLEVVRAAAAAVGHAAFYASPAGTAVAGIGAARRISTAGPMRLRDLDRAVSTLHPGPPVMVGFSFGSDGPSGADWEGFGAAAAIVPEIAVVRASGRSRVIVTPPPGSDGRHLLDLLASLRSQPPAPVGEGPQGLESRPSPDDWQRLVAEAVAAIRAGSLDKVVLARTVVLRPARPLPAFDLVAGLRDRYASCRIFGWQEGGATFIGASPELLVSRSGSAFAAEPLAGSAPRGTHPEEDRRYGDDLLGSAKDRAEHAVVVDDAIDRLRPLVDDVIVPAEPRLQRFATVQHLATPITGRTRSRLLALADALHPTPAVGGSPRDAALRFIDKVEGIDRGWYAGGVGWVEPDGDGEIALALRCALLSGERAILYAGNGIVADSDPAVELEETRLKLRPMLDLLTGV